MDAEQSESVQLRPLDDSANNSPAAAAARDEAADDYDPHQHRQLDKPTNNAETLVHLLKCSLGTGILAMPQGFARAGMVTGALATVLGGVLVTHCLHVLVRSQYEACKRERAPLLAYPAAAATALAAGPPPLRRLARPAALAVDVFLVVYQLGICCVYIVFIADNLKKVFDPYYPEGEAMSVMTYMLIILGPLIAFNLIPNLKLLAPFSALANVMTFVGLGIILYFLLSGRKPGREPQPLDLWGSPAAFPLFFGTILFALTAVGVVIALENNMKTPKAFGRPCGVLNVGMSFIVVLYVAVGALGYAYCSADCSDSITLDLPHGPLATSVMMMFALAIFISYGLHCYVPVEVLWRGYVSPRLATASPARRRFAEYALRVALCLLTFTLAAAVPQLGLFISLFGALCLSALGICFPALMEACLRFPEKASAARSAVFVKDALLFLVGLVGLVAGTYSALDAIVRSFAPKPAPTPAPALASLPLDVDATTA